MHITKHEKFRFHTNNNQSTVYDNNAHITTYIQSYLQQINKDNEIIT